MNEFYSHADLAESSPADLAAAYAYERGFDKAADYISRHFDAESFTPGDIIQIRRRNQDLDGQALDGVSFQRQEIQLADDFILTGVFPEFESLHHVELGKTARDMTLYEQFSACKADFQDHMYDLPLSKSISFGDMERMDTSQGFAPRGWTWNHGADVGSFDLVPTETHKKYGHTGGNALW